MLDSVAVGESSRNPAAINREGGGKGAYGILQVRQAALADYNKANGTNLRMDDLLKPEIGADVGAWYFGQQLNRFNDPNKALIAYKEGPNSDAVNKGDHPYASAALNRVFGSAPQQAPQKSQLLPGIPASQSQSSGDEDAIFSAFYKGTPTSSETKSSSNEDVVFSAFLKTPSSVTTAPASEASKVAASIPSQAPGSFTMGLGDIIKGGVQSAVHGIGALAERYPDAAKAINFLTGGDINADVAKDFRTGVPQVDAQIAAQEKQYAAQRAQTNPNAGFDWGRLGGNVVGSAPLAFAAPVTSSIKGAAATGAALGGLNSLITPVVGGENFAQEKKKQAGLNALLGVIAAPIAAGLGRIISPNVAPDVRALIDKGVTPTPGQILGGGAARTESKLTSVPVLGDMIKNAQQRSVADFNRAAYNEALAPIGKTFTGKVGNEGIEKVSQEIGKVYDNVLSKMSFRPDATFQQDVLNLSQMAQSLPETQQKTFMNVVKNQIFGKMGPSGFMDGPELKGVQSELARVSKGYLGDPSFDNRQLGAAISALRDAVDSNVARVNPPELANQLASANQAWANFVRLRTAAASSGAMSNEGLFTAAQLNSAVRQADKSVGKGASATGKALMQDLSGAGQRVLGQGYPDSGTVGRGLMSLLAPGAVGAGFVTSPTSTLAALGGIGLGSLPYTQTGQRVAAAILAQRPELAAPIGRAVTQVGPRVIPGLIPSLLPQRE